MIKYIRKTGFVMFMALTTMAWQSSVAQSMQPTDLSIPVKISSARVELHVQSQGKAVDKSQMKLRCVNGDYAYVAGKQQKVVADSISYESNIASIKNLTFLVGRTRLEVPFAPGETLKINVTLPNDFASSDNDIRKYVSFEGKYADIAQALLDNRNMLNLEEVKQIVKGDFEQYIAMLWQKLQKTKKAYDKNKKLSKHQKEYLAKKAEAFYIKMLIDYKNNMAFSMISNNMDARNESLLKSKTEDFKLVDGNAKQLTLLSDDILQFTADGTNYMPYLEANNLRETKAYNSLKDWQKAKTVADAIEHYSPISKDEQWMGIEPSLKAELVPVNEQVKEMIEKFRSEAGGGQIADVPDVDGKTVVSAIAKRYPGKVVFVDFWATWCGPCCKGIEAMESIKASFKGKDVVFVYITDESSPLEKWQNYLLRVPGQHYRLKKKVFGEIPNLNAIPHYKVFGRNGLEIFDTAGWSDERLTEFKEVIDKALQEK